MKKILLAIVSFAVLIGMVACSNNDNNESNKDNQNEVNEQNVEPEVEEEAPENNGNTEDEQSSDNEADGDNAEDVENVEDDQDGNNIPENIADFEETATLIEQIDIDNMNAQIETDNQNNRVIIFSEESKTKKYKSIFIKKQNRLKIISLDNDGQIFNEIIE